MKQSLFLLLLAVAASGAPAAESGGNKRLYVASHSYDIAIAPVDDASANAEKALLYTRRAAGEEWKELGEGEKIILPNGDVRFTRGVDVEQDGLYEYTSRPVVGGAVAEPPARDSLPQATVVVDTIPPKAEILLPDEDGAVAPGERLTLSWSVADENLADAPGVFTYSTDGGRSWNLIERSLAREGITHWIAPKDMTGAALVRLAAMDLAGNVGRDVRRMETPETARPEAAPPAVADGGDGAEDGTGDDADAKLRDPNRSWLYYLMAVNLMRQNKPADALHYYWLSVKADPDFVNAWADIALAYIDLGAFATARDVTEQTMEQAPDRIDLLHLMGETFHAEGMAALGGAASPEERMRAKGLIDQAVMWYGQALDRAAGEWRLAERAASFYRLGEVCYYVNMDRDGARAYWEKILSLHTPPPNSDMILWSPKGGREKEKKRQERYTYQRVALETWKEWARGYLEQMAARERAGILDLMPAQRVGAGRAGARAETALAHSGNAMNPGRGDGRSLFSLSANSGSAEGVAISAGVAGGAGYDAEQAAMAAHMNERPMTDGYSFYARDERGAAARRRGRPADGGGNRSAFSTERGGAPAQPADPYSFPQGGRGHAPWNSALPYGNKPPGS